ncbi:hypothetical protein Q8A73_017984 [Channa argus]|nr:hypothetical protein Q8A73_017984 [Channa argus]
MKKSVPQIHSTDQHSRSQTDTKHEDRGFSPVMLYPMLSQRLLVHIPQAEAGNSENTRQDLRFPAHILDFEVSVGSGGVLARDETDGQPLYSLCPSTTSGFIISHQIRPVLSAKEQKLAYAAAHVALVTMNPVNQHDCRAAAVV